MSSAPPCILGGHRGGRRWREPGPVRPPVSWLSSSGRLLAFASQFPHALTPHLRRHGDLAQAWRTIIPHLWWRGIWDVLPWASDFPLTGQVLSHFGRFTHRHIQPLNCFHYRRRKSLHLGKGSPAGSANGKSGRRICDGFFFFNWSCPD